MVRVVSVINDKLPALIPGFKLTPIRQYELNHPGQKAPKRGRGAAIVAFKATWTKENARKDVTTSSSEMPVYQRLLKETKKDHSEKMTVNDLKDIYIRMLKNGTVNASARKRLQSVGVDVDNVDKTFLKG